MLTKTSLMNTQCILNYPLASVIAVATAAVDVVRSTHVRTYQRTYYMCICDGKKRYVRVRLFQYDTAHRRVVQNMSILVFLGALPETVRHGWMGTQDSQLVAERAKSLEFKHFCNTATSTAMHGTTYNCY